MFGRCKGVLLASGRLTSERTQYGSGGDDIRVQTASEDDGSGAEYRADDVEEAELGA